jgi:hypothetical protein
MSAALSFLRSNILVVQRSVKSALLRQSKAHTSGSTYRHRGLPGPAAPCQMPIAGRKAGGLRFDFTFDKELD